MKYKFNSYYKYGFRLQLEDGTFINNKEQNSDDIYRLSIDAEGEATPTDDGKWLVDGYTFTT